MDRSGRTRGRPDAQRAPSEPEAEDPLAQLRLKLALERRKVQRKAKGAAGGPVSLPAGGGTPLASQDRGRMEQALGSDLSSVRVHTGGESQAAARGLGARAFTVGSDVHFGAGEFNPGTREGDKLLAHELTHVVQGGGALGRKEDPDGEVTGEVEGHELPVSEPGDAAEKEADDVGDQVAARLHDPAGGDKGGGARPGQAAPDKPKISAKLDGVARSATGGPAGAQAPPGLSDPGAIQQAKSTVVVGQPVSSASEGHAILSKLSQGSPDALAPIGVGTLPFAPNETEWGLGEVRQGGAPGAAGGGGGPPAGAQAGPKQFRIVRGDPGGVNWAQVPELLGIGHSHPARAVDPNAKANKDWGGEAGNGSMKLTDLMKNMDNRAKIFPSASDFHHTWLEGMDQHIVHTPYQIDPQTQEVFNPTMMRTVQVQQGQPLAFVIQRSKMKQLKGEYECELVATAGGTPVWTGKVMALAAWVPFPPTIV
jgi:hypothetical protein